MPIPYGLIIKAVIGIVGIVMLVSMFKSAGVMYDNFWTKHDNKIAADISLHENLAYQKARAEELEKTNQLNLEHHNELREVYKQQDVALKEVEKDYKKIISKDITGMLKKFEDHLVFNEKAKNASLRKLAEKRRLSDLSTVTE